MILSCYLFDHIIRCTAKYHYFIATKETLQNLLYKQKVCLGHKTQKWRHEAPPLLSFDLLQRGKVRNLVPSPLQGEG